MKKTYSFLDWSFGLLIGVHLLLLLLKILWLKNWSLELHYEEAQYWLWSTKLDWSYYSKPGMVAWMNYLSAKLFGHTELGVRFPALIAGFITTIAVYLSTKEITKDNRTAVLASLLLYFMPFFYSISLFHSTDCFLVAFGSVSFYFFQKALRENHLWHWVLTGVFIGLATLSKYSAVLIGISYFCYILFYQRNYLSKIILAGLVAMLFLTPIIIWNYQNDFVTIKHVLGVTKSSNSKTVVEIALNYLNAFLEYVGGQIAIISPFLFFFLFYKPLRKHPYKLFLFPSLFVFLFFFIVLVKKGKAPNVNWPFFNYAMLAGAIAYSIVSKKKVGILLPISLVMVVFLTLISDTRLLNTIGLKNALKKDPTKIYHQWNQLADQVEGKLEENPGYILLTDDYKLGSPLQFYLGLETKVHYLGGGARANQFTHWNEIEQLNATGKTFLFVNGGRKVPSSISEQFSNQEFIKEVPIIWRGHKQNSYYIHRFSGAKKEQLKSAVKGF